MRYTMFAIKGFGEGMYLTNRLLWQHELDNEVLLGSESTMRELAIGLRHVEAVVEVSVSMTETGAVARRDAEREQRVVAKLTDKGQVDAD